MEKSCFMSNFVLNNINYIYERQHNEQSNYNQRYRPRLPLVLGRRTLFQKVRDPFPKPYNLAKRDGRPC